MILTCTCSRCERRCVRSVLRSATVITLQPPWQDCAAGLPADPGKTTTTHRACTVSFTIVLLRLYVHQSSGKFVKLAYQRVRNVVRHMRTGSNLQQVAAKVAGQQTNRWTSCRSSSYPGLFPCGWMYYILVPTSMDSVRIGYRYSRGRPAEVGWGGTVDSEMSEERNSIEMRRDGLAHIGTHVNLRPRDRYLLQISHEGIQDRNTD